ncbi:hypothetical protein B0O79_3875 [Flavobacteriaceae bacterium MAR_2009_75]|nr:hypothetical protein B0O79_3875 [Flavobacteriaceae bacterium MAR_2009_75]
MNIKEKIEKTQNEFSQNLWEIDDFVFETKLSYAFYQDKYKELLEKNKPDDEGMTLFTRINSKIPKHTLEINVLAIINAVARTEAYLNDILECLFLWNRKSLISDKTITYKEAIEFENIDELIKSIRQREILEFSHSSFKDKLKFLNKKFNLTFPEIEKVQDEIIELFTTRNIILHNNGIVNQTYIKQNKRTKLKLGSKRVVDEDYTRNGIRNLRTIGYSVAGNVIEKINK